MNAMTDRDLSPEQVVQLTQAMLSVAAMDGIQPAEAALIGRFYEASRNPAMPPVEAMIAGSAASRFEPASLAGSPADFADTVVLMCLMTAYADGHISPAERSHVLAIATAMGMAETRLQAHLAQVQDDLVGALAHLPDTGSVAAVMREL
jgi:uncharacterized tellurite resistance protein B-like protein